VKTNFNPVKPSKVNPFSLKRRRVFPPRFFFFLKLEEGGRGATAIRPSFREEQHPVLPPTFVVLLWMKHEVT
jgi:hypothetical protein